MENSIAPLDCTNSSTSLALKFANKLNSQDRLAQTPKSKQRFTASFS